MRLVASVLGIDFVIASRPGTSVDTMLLGAQAWGASTNGLRTGISTVVSGSASSTGAEFYITFENTGGADFVLNLGWMLGNGKAMFPTRVGLVLTDPAGRTRDLEVPTPRVAGRVDDFIVALPKGATYRLRVSLSQYWSPATKDFQLKLADGKHHIAARFEGRDASQVNLDMRGVTLLNFWTGKVQSDSVEFLVSK